MTESTFCPSCGAQRAGSFRFCRSCGFDFDTATPGVTIASPAPPAPAAPAVEPTRYVNSHPTGGGRGFHLRKSTLAIIIWTVGIAVWYLSVANGAPDPCAGLSGADLDACRTGVTIGQGVGLGLFGGIWLLGMVPLGLVWAMTRKW